MMSIMDLERFQYRYERLRSSFLAPEFLSCNNHLNNGRIRVIEHPSAFDFQISRPRVTQHSNNSNSYLSYANHRVYHAHDFHGLVFYDLAETWYIFPPIVPSLMADIVAERILTNFAEYTAKRMCIHLCEVMNSSNEPLRPRLIEHFLKFYRRSEFCRLLSYAGSILISVSSHLHRFSYEKDLVCHFWREICDNDLLNCAFVEDGIPMEHVEFIFRECNRARFNFRRFLTERVDRNEIGPHSICPVLASFYRPNYPLFKTFLLHGFEINTSYVSIRVQICRSMLFRRMSPEMFDHFNTFLEIARGQRFPMLEIFVVAFIHANLPLYRFVELAFCTKILYRSIPDPYISLVEFRQFLTDSPVPFTIKNTIWSEFERLTRIRTEVTYPRSLKQLSRCVVRKLLRDNFQLPHGIWELRLGAALSDYLRLEP